MLGKITPINIDFLSIEDNFCDFPVFDPTNFPTDNLYATNGGK